MASSTNVATSPSSRSVISRYLTALVVANLFVIGLIAVALASSYATHRQMAAVAADNMSKVLEENLARFIDKVDLTLLATIDEINREKAAGGIDGERLDDVLARHDARIPETLGLRVVDANGIVTHAVTNVIAKNADISDAGSFLHSKTTDDDALFVSPPLLSPISGNAAIGLSRRLRNDDGSFAGQVHAGVAVGQLAQMFAAVDLGPKGSVTLTDAKARVIARSPNPSGELGLIKTPITLPTLASLIGEGRHAAAYHTRSAVDGVTRNYFFRQVNGRAMYVLVGIADDDYLAGFYHEAEVMGALCALFLVISGTAAVLLSRDWAHRLAASQELSRKDSALTLFRQAIDRSNDAILIVDPRTGALIDFNQTACEQLGYAREELRQLSLTDLDVDLPDATSWAEIAKVLLGDHDGLLFERIHRRKDGSSFPVEVSWRIVTINGQPLGISVERDATEKRRNQEEMRRKTAELERANSALVESNADLERFAYVASHDLQTPLRSIISFTQLLERRHKQHLDEEGQEFLAFIVSSAKRMSALINDLLQYARVTSQGQPLTAVSAEAAVKAALDNLSPQIAETGAQLDIAPLPRVMADESQLISLFQNLIGNALKYRHPERAPQIAVTAAPASPTHWRITVSDNGIGIDPAYHQKIFEIFQRLNPGGTVEGTGVGLSVCQRILRRFGGDIWVESSPGAGSVFHFAIGRAD